MNASETAFTASAIDREWDLSTPYQPSPECKNAGVERGGGSQHPFTGVVHQSSAFEQVSGVTEGDVCIIDRPRPWQDADDKCDKWD